MDGILDKCQVAHTYILGKCRGVWFQYSSNGPTLVGRFYLIPVFLELISKIFGAVWYCHGNITEVPYLTLIFLILGIYSIHLIELG